MYDQKIDTLIHTQQVRFYSANFLVGLEILKKPGLVTQKVLYENRVLFANSCSTP